MKQRGAHNAIFKKMSIKGKTQDQQRKSAGGAMHAMLGSDDDEEVSDSVPEMDVVREREEFDGESIRMSHQQSYSSKQRGRRQGTQKNQKDLSAKQSRSKRGLQDIPEIKQQEQPLARDSEDYLKSQLHSMKQLDQR